MTPVLKTRYFDKENARFERAFPETLQRILLARGICCDADLDQRLASLEPPHSLKGLNAAVDLLENALTEQKAVLVCGDYDADGATATALIIRVLRAMGLQNIDFLVPNRFDFGYGLSSELVAVAAQNAPDLIVTVDNGISSLEGVAAAKARGINVLVTDHHLPGAELPEADAILNPNQPNCDFPSKNLAGVGVVFYLLIALRARLRERDWFAQNGIAEPRLERYLDIVALGTVADLVPLDRLNRILVSQGLRLIRSGQGNPGIRALLEVSGRDPALVTSADLGFAVGPRINAAGRLDDIAEGIQCLLSDHPAEAHQQALDLHQINQERRQIQGQMLVDAERALASIQLDQDDLPWGYCCFQPDWHQGLVGLVAARVKERIHRPVIAFAPAEDTGELKGSARSIAGLHIRDCLELVHSRHPGLIQKFGGHAMAAGLSIGSEDFERFQSAFDEAIRSMIDREALEAVVWTDGELGPQDYSLDFARTLEALLPWGQAVPEPQFRGQFEVVDHRWLKEAHLKLRLAAADGAEVVDAIWFNAPAKVVQANGDFIDAVYRLSINRFRGAETLQLMLVHAEAAS